MSPQSTDLGTECAEVPLIELLRGIPNDARLTWTEPDGLKATHFVPVGIYAHRAADDLERLDRERAEWSSLAAARNLSNVLLFEERDRLRADIENLKQYTGVYSQGWRSPYERPAPDVKCRHSSAKAKAIRDGLDSIVCECGTTLTAQVTRRG